jgi:predicted transposase/invertase (TIGR01784 family)
MDLSERVKPRGKAEGRAEGRAEGKNEEKIEIARNLLKLNLTNEQISQSTGLSIKEIEALGTNPSN